MRDNRDKSRFTQQSFIDALFAYTMHIHAPADGCELSERGGGGDEMSGGYHGGGKQASSANVQIKVLYIYIYAPPLSLSITPPVSLRANLNSAARRSTHVIQTEEGSKSRWMTYSFYGKTRLFMRSLSHEMAERLETYFHSE